MPWPLVPLLLGSLVLLAGIVLVQVHRYVAAPASLPIYPGFKGEILPAVLGLWAALIAAFLVTGREYLWAVLPWATVTLIMLWPVGRRLRREYLSYRTVGFVLGVVSMAYILLAGFALETPASFGVKSAIFFGLVADLTIFGIVPSLHWGIAKPIGMFFRPDLLFGDGRVLCCGMIAMVLGLRYLWGSPPMGGVPWPIPRWNWYAIFFAMVAGFVPMIAVRGVLKLLMRMRRIRDGRWAGWGAVFLREALLVVTALSIGYGFHNAFMGAAPFTVPILTTDPDFWPALLITLAGAAIVIFGRGALKKAIGDPFIRETLGQSFAKQILLVAGLLLMFYGFMSLLHMDPMHTQMGVNGLRRWDNAAKIWRVGLPLFLWGLTVLIPFRVWAQHHQRHAIVAQMAAVILPPQPAPARAQFLRSMMRALLDMPAKRRKEYLITMNRALAEAPAEDRAATTLTTVEVLAELSPGEQERIMESQAAALGALEQEQRLVRMADMMTAVSQLPAVQRQAVVERMAAVLR